MIIIGTERGLLVWKPEHNSIDSFEGALGRVTSVAVTGTGDFFAVVDRERVVAGDAVEGHVETLAEGLDLTPASVATHGGEVVYVGTEPPAVFRLDRSLGRWERIGDLQSQPFAAGWSSPSGRAAVRSIAPHPDTPGGLYADIHVGGVVRTLDGGLTWEAVAKGLELDVHEVVTTPTRPSDVYAATADGFYRSYSEGDSWQRCNEGLENLYCRAVAIHPQCPEIILVSGSPMTPGEWGPEGKRFGVFRSEDRGDTWWRVMHGLPPEMPEEVDTFCLCFSTLYPDRAFCARKDGILYESLDTGLTWEEVVTGLPRIYALSAA